MHVLVFFDITSNKIRKKMNDVCLDYGLERTQFSAFVGDIVAPQQRELMLKLKRLLGDQPGALLLIPISQQEWQNRLEHRQDAPGDGISTHASSIIDRETDDGTLY